MSTRPASHAPGVQQADATMQSLVANALSDVLSR